MKATFSSTKTIDFKPIDLNESILLKNFNDISEGRISIRAEKIKNEDTEYSLIVKDPSNIVEGDNLNSKTIHMKFPAKINDTVLSHGIITTKGGVEFTCVVDENNNIIIKMITSSDEVILYNRSEDGNITVNTEILKIQLTQDMTVNAINTASMFYHCFMI